MSRHFTLKGIEPIVAASVLTACLVHGAELHVAPGGGDQGNGSGEAPFKTISAAARIAQPGDVVTVHAGVYRERINPPRGGTADGNRIVYQAAPGEKVVIKGSEVVTGWEKLEHDTWKVSLPNGMFGDSNPYANEIKGDWFDPKGRKHHTGAVYMNGHWLTEAAALDEVMKPAGEAPLWFGRADKSKTSIWAQLPGLDPNRDGIEINVRQAVFYPEKPGINYITVRGFTLEQAATPWAPPTAEQVGLIGTHWSKGWIIEGNEIRYSTCVGVTLGKYGDEWDNRAPGAAGYVGTINRALANGWSRRNIGHHTVRDNHIHQCEQAGIVGSMGGVFSTITGNEIHDIHVRRLFSGAEMAGIKLHAPIDTLIRHNHIYRCNRGIWLDWMAQGTRVTGNLLHDNASAGVNWPENWEALIPGGEQDMFIEVNHGPILIDNNIFLSPYSVNDRSQGVAFVHNLFAGAFRIVRHDGRKTPYHRPHSTEVVALRDNPCGDHRFLNNIFVERCDLSGFDAATLPVAMDGNLYLKGARPSKHEARPFVRDETDPELRLVQEPGGWHLQLVADEAWAGSERLLVTSELLGKAVIPDVPFEQPDGQPYRIDTDYFGKSRNAKNPFPGPVELPSYGRQRLKVWPAGQ